MWPAYPGIGAEYPMFGARYFACLRFVKQAGLNLPTEAQWEYACRAGTTDATYNGPLDIAEHNRSGTLEPIAWHRGNSFVDYHPGVPVEGDERVVAEHLRDLLTREAAGAVPPLRRIGTHPVGGKRPNGFGLHDMLGNVAETCREWSFGGEYGYIGVVADHIVNEWDSGLLATGRERSGMRGKDLALTNPVSWGTFNPGSEHPRFPDGFDGYASGFPKFPERLECPNFSARGGSYAGYESCRAGARDGVHDYYKRWSRDVIFIGLRAAFELPRPEGVEGDWTVK
ncbi:MAG: SUMF1/EgtB/PvdO family nonheme iron enzyme [Planctomycetes bacterium]|nr:SUMF1/EgtB/PvdO family nonheme iron enzyme [Planctomycetota bacterium]